MFQSTTLAATLAAAVTFTMDAALEAKMQVQVVDALVKVLPEGPIPRDSAQEIFIERCGESTRAPRSSC